jgi:MtN3 and saliva related transmembrane protein
VVTLIGSLAAVLTTACWVPQVVKLSRLGDADEFAWPYLAMLMAGLTSWLVYGLFRRDLPLILCNAITGVLVVFVVVVKVRGVRAHAPKEPAEATVD